MHKVNKISIIEEVINAVIHGIGIILSIIGLKYLLTSTNINHNSYKIAGFVIFGVSLIVMYLTSTLFHSLSFTKAKKVFRIIDHSSIFVFIAGSYSPVALIPLKGSIGWFVFIAVWVVAIIGIIIKALAIDKVRTVLPYLIMGWLGALLVIPLSSKIPLSGIIFLLLGGLLYTFGTIFYSWKKLPFSHCVWHLFILSGTACHYALIYSLK